MRVFFVIDEAYPLFKIGGLGDVGGSLPKALSSLGIDVSIILPLHPSMKMGQEYVFAGKYNIAYGEQTLPITISKSLFPGTTIPVYLIGENVFISKATDASDNHADKFAVFSLAVATFIHTLPADQKPQLVHLHDWHTALIPLISQHLLGETDQKFLLTIHNLMYQGVTYTPIIEKLHIAKKACQLIDWDIQDHNINILLEGILHADSVSTVSTQYAKEILTSEYGEHINEIIAAHQKPIHGITNGLDTVDFDPATDKALYQTYDVTSYKAGKLANKNALQRELGLPNSPHPMLGFVGRVDTNQKGIQLIIEAIINHQLATDDQQFVFLGTGDRDMEKNLHEITEGRLNYRIVTRYDESLARKIYAACDLLLIPSKFEPCGLIQMIANRYGTLPVAHATGGLIDTIKDGDNGFLFSGYETTSMLSAIARAITALQNPNVAESMIISAMNRDFSWGTAAVAYQRLYQSIINSS